MVLDEPTNDLDAETLELLEDLLGNYPGTVLLVSHDRAFLNNVVTSTLVLNGDGTVSEYDGGYDDYLRQRPSEQEPETSPKKNRASGRVRENEQKPKLSYKEKKELEEIPQKIDDLEQTQASLQSAMADPEFFKQDGEKIASETARLQALSKDLESLYNRWEELAAKE
ncbi:hypothetical protein [Thalassoglobus sp.]|uniref:hypothetical protein n=1 Tax=Thalassoglobus sp. TaxID=2795869 RepID=UPI003AA7DE0F